MAANSKALVAATSFGKRLFLQAASVLEPAAPAPAFLTSASRRGVHTSSYDKNIDDLVAPVAVPENVIGSQEATSYWAPNPKTGVFGPADAQTGFAGGDQGTVNGPTSVLDQKVWFRPLEDVDKSAHYT